MSFHRYMSAYRQLSTLQEKKPAIEQRASTFSQLVTHFTVTLPDPQHNVTLQQLRQLQSTANQELAAVNTEIAEVERVLGEKFKKTDGPFFRTLECTLASLHVERHAYHGGTFVGNHVHKLVQEKSVESLCTSITAVAESTALVEQAKEVADRFRVALNVFGKCHNIYNGGVTDEATIDQLERDITSFLGHYRATFPEATVLPKMHILEDYVVPWMRQWHLGSGLMGEQGAESIHAHMHRLERQYSNIVNPLQKL